MQELGRGTARHLAQAGQWKYSILWMSCSAYEWGLAGEQGYFVSRFSKFKTSIVQKFKLFWDFGGFFRSLANFSKIWVQGSVIAAWGLAANQSLGGEKNCIVYSLFCIIIIIISSRSSISSSISFVILLNHLYLNPWVLPFVHSPPHSTRGEGEGWASGCPGLSCQLPD